MQRCLFCKKIVWFWQPQYLGLDTAHKSCDYKIFCKGVDDLLALGFFTPVQAKTQKARRLQSYF